MDIYCNGSVKNITLISKKQFADYVERYMGHKQWMPSFVTVFKEQNSQRGSYLYIYSIQERNE